MSTKPFGVLMLGGLLTLLFSLSCSAKFSIDKDPLKHKSFRHARPANIVGNPSLNGLNPALIPTPAPVLIPEDEDIPLQSNFLAPTHPSITYNTEDIVDDHRIFVTTVDGRYHLINGNNVEWSSDSNDPTVFAMDNVADNHPRDTDYKRVIPDVDGALLILTADGMRKTHTRASELADKAPYISEDGIAFTSEKSSRVIQIDMTNGHIKDFSKLNIIKRRNNDFDGETPGETECAIPFYLSRVDYSISGIDIASGEVFQVSYSDVEPLQKSMTNKAKGTAGRLTGPESSLIKRGSANAEDNINDTPEQSVFGFELQTSPNGEIYFSDADGNFLSKFPVANLGSLVKSAYVVQIPPNDDGEVKVRPVNNIHKLTVNRRMNGPVHSSDGLAAVDGSVFVQNIDDGQTKGVYAIEIQPTCENCDDTKGNEIAVATKNESLLLCPPVGSASLGSKQDALCIAMEEGKDPQYISNGGEEDSGEDGKLPAVTYMTPPKAVTTPQPQLPAIGSKIYIGGNPAKIGHGLNNNNNVNEKQPVVIPVVDSNNGKQNISVSVEEPKVIVIPEPSTPGCKIFCQCSVRDALDFFGTNPNNDEDCIDMDMCCDPKPLVSLEPSENTSLVLPNSYKLNSVTGQHKLLSDPYEGRIFKPAIDNIDYEPLPLPTSMNDHEAVSTVVVKIPLYKRIFRFINHLSKEQWFLPLCLIVFILLVATVGPNNYYFATILESILGKTVAIQGVPSANIIKTTQSSDKLKLSATTSSPDLKTNATTKSSSTTVTPTPTEVEEVDEFGRKITRIGALVIQTEPILGLGSHGTVVFPGSLNGRPVAVKRMLSQFHKSADREISLLIRSDGHPNVVRYFLREQRSDFVYLALQLCQMSLKDFVVKVKTHQQSIAYGTPSNSEKANEKSESITDAVRRSLLQIAQGLTHLHSHRIVHRDIKPHNILCASINEADFSSNEAPSPSGSTIKNLDQLGDFVLKISDMGLSKQLDKNETSFSSMSFSMSMSIRQGMPQPAGLNNNTDIADTPDPPEMLNNPVGTIGWQAPELLGGRRNTISRGGPTADPPSGSSLPMSLSQKDGASIQDDIMEDLVGDDEEGDSDAEEESSELVLASEGATDSNNSSVSTPKTPTQANTIALVSANRMNRKRTQTVDIFSLGCVFYYVLTLGDHPYGEWYERESNIVSNRMDLTALQDSADGVDLISRMLQPDPLRRPSGKEVCFHPFFWSSNRRLEFLVEFSDRLEQEPADSSVVLAVESGAVQVVGYRWDRKLDTNLLEDMGKYRKYDLNSVRDLLRVIRNKRHHYHELSAEVKASIGTLPVGFFSYFEKRFPKLLLHCVSVAERYLSTDRLFAHLFYKKKVVPVLAPLPVLPLEPVIEAETETVCDGLDTSMTVEATSAKEFEGVSQSVKSDVSLMSENALDVVVWQGSVLESTLKCKGWWRSTSDWIEGGSAISGSKKARPNHVAKALTDPKFRTQLCEHWEKTNQCAMRKKAKCIFAHGPMELRIKGKSKWGKGNPNVEVSPEDALRLSGGEDWYNAARGGVQKNRNDIPNNVPSPIVRSHVVNQFDGSPARNNNANNINRGYQQASPQMQYQHHQQQQAYFQSPSNYPNFPPMGTNYPPGFYPQMQPQQQQFYGQQQQFPQGPYDGYQYDEYGNHRNNNM